MSGMRGECAWLRGCVGACKCACVSVCVHECACERAVCGLDWACGLGQGIGAYLLRPDTLAQLPERAGNERAARESVVVHEPHD